MTATKLINRRTTRILVVFLFLVFLVIILKNAGTYLVKTDKLQKSDAILILMGSIPDRVMHAANLYNDSLAPHVLLVEENMGGMGWLRKKGYLVHSNSEQMQSLAIQMGISQESITILPGDARSTLDEAQALVPYLIAHPSLDTLILVSSASHMRRAGLIFDKVMKANDMEMVILTSPSSYSDFNAHDWYKHREDIQTVFSEYIKLGVFLVFEQWGLETDEFKQLKQKGDLSNLSEGRAEPQRFNSATLLTSQLSLSLSQLK